MLIEDFGCEISSLSLTKSFGTRLNEKKRLVHIDRQERRKVAWEALADWQSVTSYNGVFRISKNML